MKNPSTIEKSNRTKRINSLGGKIKGTNTGKKYYNNGMQERFFFENQQPENWVPGRLRNYEGFQKGDLNIAKKPEVRKKISNSLKNSVKFKESIERRDIKGINNPAKREDVRRKISEHTKGKKKIRRMLNYKASGSITGKKLYNSGLNMKYFFENESPNGWTLDRLIKHKGPNNETN